MRKLTSIIIILALLFLTATIAHGKGYDWVSIPKVGISERVQWAGYNLDTQAICDKRDRAVAYPYRGGVGIADHNYQGFKNLPRVRVGYTATVTLHGRTNLYRCVKVIPNGLNKSAYLTDHNGRTVNLKSNQIQMYTCNGRGSWVNIYITIWQKVR